jgi:hypothetical protein
MNYYSFIGAQGQDPVLLSGTSRVGEPDGRGSLIGAQGQDPVLLSGTSRVGEPDGRGSCILQLGIL